MMEHVAYGGWPNCVRLANGLMELVVTTDVGPRVIRCGFVGGRNLFGEFAPDMGRTSGERWLPFGGHRLWHSPENVPRTYHPDFDRVEAAMDGGTLRLRQPVEQSTGIEKQIDITLDAREARVTVLHRLVNRGLWDIELAPWALTIMARGGRAIVPQEPHAPWPDALLPVRPLVLWGYTDMTDPRWTWGRRFIQLRQDPGTAAPQKIGLRNSAGWGAYVLGGDVFIKRAPFDPAARYPDFGSNWELFTNGDMLELETLGPLGILPANGGTVEHREEWSLIRAEVGMDDASIESKVAAMAGA